MAEAAGAADTAQTTPAGDTSVEGTAGMADTARPGNLASVVTRAAGWAGDRPWALPLLAAVLGIAVRLWLVIHTHAMIDGDEAMVGIQAERILHGQFPVYYYGQVYMGVLEAYLIAPLIALFGPTTWALRLVPILLSPLLVVLTYRLARVLLPNNGPFTPLLAGLAALVAGVPPLYAAVAEMRTWGGQIEVYIVSLALLLCAAELAVRLRADASAWELTRRWAFLGFFVGLGIWINPLVVYALVAGALWLLAALVERAAPRLAARVSRRASMPIAATAPDASATVATSPAPHSATAWGRLGLPLLALLPGLAVGGLPAWLYALRQGGANLLVYVSQPAVSGAVSGAARHGRVFLAAAITFRYVTCVAPNVLSGRLPTETALLLPLRLLLLLPPVLAIVCGLWLLVARRGTAGNGASPPLRVGLPLLFAGVVSAIFCLGTAAWPQTQTNGCAKDLAGRYGVPLVLVEPLLLLALLALPALLGALRARASRGAATPTDAGNSGAPTSGSAGLFARTQAQATPLLVLVLVVAGLLQTATYALASPTQTFQSPYYHRIPATTTQLVAYLRDHNIHAAWCNHWLGNIVTFATDGNTVCADYYDQVYHQGLRRPPGTLATVSAADRPSFILILTDPRPCLARQLDAQGIAYTLTVLPQDGVTVITPARTVDPASVLAGLGQDYVDPSAPPDLACPV